jgi:hypothetical protein
MLDYQFAIMAAGNREKLEGVLLEPYEGVHREIKSWLDISDDNHRANLAKAMLALANSGGGQILVGYEEVEGSWEPDTSRPDSIDQYDQDDINGIVQSYADPQFHCKVRHIQHPDIGEEFPLIIVPGGHTVPIRAQRGGPNGNHVTVDRYYIRRPGPESAPPQTGREWDELIRRCITESKEELTDSIRNVITGFQMGETVSDSGSTSDERIQEWASECKERWLQKVEEKYEDLDSSPYEYGYWTFSYLILDDFSQPNLIDFRDILRNVQGHETGWPPWLSANSANPVNDTIERWIPEEDTGTGTKYNDFWRASPNGILYSLRTYESDNHSEIDADAGKAFDYIRPLWTVGECVLHAKRLAQSLCDEKSQIMFYLTWNGISGRTLVSLYPGERGGLLGPPNKTAYQDSVESSAQFSAAEIENNLPEVVTALTSPLYQSFDFYEPSTKLVQNQLDRMT